MRVRFNGKEYTRKAKENAYPMRELCFDIFKYYLKVNPEQNYFEVKNIFNTFHCTSNQVVMNEEDRNQLTEDQKTRYFKPVAHNNMLLYFTKMWGNNGIVNGKDCDNISHVVQFAKNQGYDINILEEDIIENIKSKYMQIKNIILYGAPGVGKTHNYKNLISMIEEGKSQKEIFDTISKNLHVSLENETFEKIKAEKRVEFVTFHQSYSYEDFIEGFRPQESGNIELEDGIFKVIAEKAINNIKEKDYQHISFEEAYDIFREQYLNGELEVIKTVSNAAIFIREYKERFIKAQTENAKDIQHIKKSDLETTVNGVLTNQVLKPADIKKLDVKKDAHSLAGYYFPFAQKIVEIMKENKVQKETQKNFYIVIDEINRGNISKIFGELITLIEEDKRDKYEVTLPYSKTKFKVPSNLYIIATMNSTDKSIATIDIALRRRFTFLKMQPNLELVKNEQAKVFMQKANEYISEKLGEDYMLGHSYFMGDVDLDFIKEYKVKPLLEEYFYADEKSSDEIMNEIEDKRENI